MINEEINEFAKSGRTLPLNIGEIETDNNVVENLSDITK